jgi:hypothetical protein
MHLSFQSFPLNIGTYDAIKQSLYRLVCVVFLVTDLNVLTRNTPLIHTLFTYSKWNMYPKLMIWAKNDGKKWSRKNIFEIPPCAKPFSEFFFTS